MRRLAPSSARPTGRGVRPRRRSRAAPAEGRRRGRLQPGPRPPRPGPLPAAGARPARPARSTWSSTTSPVTGAAPAPTRTSRQGSYLDRHPRPEGGRRPVRRLAPRGPCRRRDRRPRRGHPRPRPRAGASARRGGRAGRRAPQRPDRAAAHRHPGRDGRPRQPRSSRSSGRRGSSSSGRCCSPSPPGRDPAGRRHPRGAAGRRLPAGAARDRGHRPRWGGGRRLEGHVSHALADRAESPTEIVVVYTDGGGSTPDDRFPRRRTRDRPGGAREGLDPEAAQSALVALMRSFRADAIVNVNSRCSTSRCAATAGRWPPPNGSSCASSATSEPAGRWFGLEPALLLPDLRRCRRRADRQRAPRRELARAYRLPPSRRDPAPGAAAPPSTPSPLS